MEDKSGLIILGLVIVLVVISVISTYITFVSVGTAPVDKGPTYTGKLGFSVSQSPESPITQGKVGVMIQKPPEDNESET